MTQSEYNCHTIDQKVKKTNCKLIKEQVNEVAFEFQIITFSCRDNQRLLHQGQANVQHLPAHCPH